MSRIACDREDSEKKGSREADCGPKWRIRRGCEHDHMIVQHDVTFAGSACGTNLCFGSVCNMRQC